MAEHVNVSRNPLSASGAVVKRKDGRLQPSSRRFDSALRLHAPIVQRIGHRASNPWIGVRVLVGALAPSSKG